MKKMKYKSKKNNTCNQINKMIKINKAKINRIVIKF